MTRGASGIFRVMTEPEKIVAEIPLGASGKWKENKFYQKYGTKIILVVIVSLMIHFEDCVKKCQKLIFVRFMDLDIV